jgi:hypothetical protein
MEKGSCCPRPINGTADCTDLAGAPVAVDQRGLARPGGIARDLGAYEVKTFTGPLHVVLALLARLESRVRARLQGPLHQIEARRQPIPPTVPPADRFPPL